MNDIVKELRKPMHYLSMAKRKQAAGLIEKLQAIIADQAIIITDDQSLIDAQYAKIEAMIVAGKEQNATIKHLSAR